MFTILIAFVVGYVAGGHAEDVAIQLKRLYAWAKTKLTKSP